MESLLLALGFIGVTLAILTPFVKSGAGLTIVSLAFYFRFIGLDAWLPIILFTAGLLLIVFELFVPDFGVAGVIGIVLLISGLYLTIGDLSQTVRDLSISVVITTGVVIYLVRTGYSLANVQKFVLTSVDPGSNTEKTRSKEVLLKVGDEGHAVTTLRPSGKVSFNDEKPAYDVLSIDGHISAGTSVVVNEIKGTKIKVSKK